MWVRRKQLGEPLSVGVLEEFGGVIFMSERPLIFLRLSALPTPYQEPERQRGVC